MGAPEEDPVCLESFFCSPQHILSKRGQQKAKNAIVKQKAKNAIVPKLHYSLPLPIPNIGTKFVAQKMQVTHLLHQLGLSRVLEVLKLSYHCILLFLKSDQGLFIVIFHSLQLFEGLFLGHKTGHNVLPRN